MSSKLSYPPKYEATKDRIKYFTSPQVQERLTCVKCKDILIKPHQSECGCRFCYSCIEEHFKDCHKSCPGCYNFMESIKENIVYDKAAEKEIFELEITCINGECKNICKLKELRKHLEECEHREEKCKECGDLYLYKERENHKSITCKAIEVLCKDCDTRLSRKDLEEKHRNANGDVNDLCDNWKGVCPYGCSKEVQDSIKVHLRECPEMKVACVMKDIGCTVVLSRKNMDEHIRLEGNHVNLMMIEMCKLKKENIDIKSKFYNYEKMQSLEIENLKGTVAKSSVEIRKLTEKVIFYEKKYVKLEKEALLLKQNLTSNGINTYISDDNVIYGEITWKIDNIVQKIKDAKMGINVVLFSEPFYSSFGGYKMCLKAYPNGDGSSSGTHFSLYFVIMMGEYDDNLSWPYNHKISLSLLANDKSLKNHSMNMKPDVNNQCYGKPTMKYNLAAGHPKFVSHVELIGTAEFMKDDAIYIHSRVF